jgi:nicotinate-nucleotide adenylyltransferase
MTKTQSKSSPPARVGVFGGTFDPIHQGHLVLAEQCREQARLDRVLFIPAARPPHKTGDAMTAIARRAEMVRLAVAGHPAFEVDELEKDRPGPSYTVDTLEELQPRYPGAQLCLLIGADSLAELATWRDAARIGELAELVIAARPGWSAEGTAMVAGRRTVVAMPLIDIASRDLRRWAADGRSLRYLVPRAVECYIETHRLYRHERASPAT